MLRSLVPKLPIHPIRTNRRSRSTPLNAILRFPVDRISFLLVNLRRHELSRLEVGIQQFPFCVSALSQICFQFPFVSLKLTIVYGLASLRLLHRFACFLALCPPIRVDLFRPRALDVRSSAMLLPVLPLSARMVHDWRYALSFQQTGLFFFFLFVLEFLALLDFLLNL